MTLSSPGCSKPTRRLQNKAAIINISNLDNTSTTRDVLLRYHVDISGVGPDFLD